MRKGLLKVLVDHTAQLEVLFHNMYYAANGQLPSRKEWRHFLAAGASYKESIGLAFNKKVIDALNIDEALHQ